MYRSRTLVKCEHVFTTQIRPCYVIVMHELRCAVPDEVGQLLFKAMGLDEYKEEDEDL